MSFSEIDKKLREAFAAFVLTLKTQTRLRHVMNLVFPLFLKEELVLSLSVHLAVRRSPSKKKKGDKLNCITIPRYRNR